MLIALSSWTRRVSRCMDWLSGLFRLMAVLWLWCRWICPRCIRRLSHSLRNSALRVYCRQNLNAVRENIHFCNKFVHNQSNYIFGIITWPHYIIQWSSNSTDPCSIILKIHPYLYPMLKVPQANVFVLYTVYSDLAEQCHGKGAQLWSYSLAGPGTGDTTPTRTWPKAWAEVCQYGLECLHH